MHLLLDSFGPDRTFELGILATTFRRSSVDEVFDAIAGYGLTCTHWDWACVPGFSSLPSAIPVETARSVARAAARSGVRICSISAAFNLIQPLVRDRGLSRLPALAEAALSVGSDFLTLCTGTRHPTDMWAYHPVNSSRKAWSDMIAGLRRASRIASRYGIRLAIEPEGANVVCDAASAERVLEELGPDSEPISIILNAANLYPPPIDPLAHPAVIDDALERLGEYISLAKVCPAGRDILPCSDYLAALAQTPGISVTAESGRRLPLLLHGMSEGEVSAAVAFVRGTIEALGRSWRSTRLDELVAPKRNDRTGSQTLKVI
jgi:hypothetical protein